MTEEMVGGGGVLVKVYATVDGLWVGRWMIIIADVISNVNESKL